MPSMVYVKLKKEDGVKDRVAVGPRRDRPVVQGLNRLLVPVHADIGMPRTEEAVFTHLKPRDRERLATGEPLFVSDCDSVEDVNDCKAVVVRRLLRERQGDRDGIAAPRRGAL